MRILWTVNIIPRDYARALGRQGGTGGGWIDAMLDQMRTKEDVQLYVACKNDVPKASAPCTQDGISYISLLYGQTQSLEEQCQAILQQVKPDLVQIDGTEFPHATAMFQAAKSHSIPTLVSLQGVLNGLYPYECGELPLDEMMLSTSMTKMFAAWMLYLRKVIWFKPRMKAEKAILEQAEYVTGRTNWDRAHLYAINPKARYFAVNRILRAPFYTAQWEISRIERHSIYVGNGYYALKGLHFMLQALPLLVKEYPDVKLYVSGNKPFEEQDRRPLFKRGYGGYLKKLIKENHLEKQVVFTGSLSAEQMVERFLKSHLYVLCSTIENSPNTLGEAMLLGCPCVSAYAGGAPEMAEEGKEVLFYRSNDPALLAWSIKRIFDDDGLALALSQNARSRAQQTHSPSLNSASLYNAYKVILSQP